MKKVKIPPTKLGVELFIRGLDPKDIYEPLGFTPQYFNQLLWGRRKSQEAFQKIAELLKIPLEDLYDGPSKVGRPKNEENSL